MLVVFLDLFLDADLLFVRSETIKKRRTNRGHVVGEANEHWFFAYFREKIHIKIYRMIISHFLYGVYLCLLILEVWNPFEDVEDEDHWNHWNHWYSYLALFFAVSLLIDDVISLSKSTTGTNRFFQSFWNPYNLAKNLIMVQSCEMSRIR